jgi:rare lipoprotein A
MPPSRIRIHQGAAGRWGRLGSSLAAVVLAAGCSVLQPSARHEAPVQPLPPPMPAAVEAPVAVAPPPAPVPPPAPPAPPVTSSEDATPKVENIPSGSPNVPYVIEGERYVPANSDVPMAQSGIASWYGKPFHGRKTANGEVYDMHRMSAAHKTMPLPSYALVRSRDNGREVIVRVNDRGPFVRGRVIDLSYAAAKVLGIVGLGKVDVVRLTKEEIVAGTWRKGARDALYAKAGLPSTADLKAALQSPGTPMAGKSGAVAVAAAR